MTRVKICGIKEKAHALVAIEAGSGFIGLIFAPSPRQIEPTQAEEIASAAAFLVSDKASGVTGVAFPADGGFTAL